MDVGGQCGRVLPGNGQRRRRAIQSNDFRTRQMNGTGNCNTAAADAYIHDGSRPELSRKVDEQLGFRSRNQNCRAYFGLEAIELLAAPNVRQWLSTGPPF